MGGGEGMLVVGRGAVEWCGVCVCGGGVGGGERGVVYVSD